MASGLTEHNGNISGARKVCQWQTSEYRQMIRKKPPPDVTLPVFFLNVSGPFVDRASEFSLSDGRSELLKVFQLFGVHDSASAKRWMLEDPAWVLVNVFRHSSADGKVSLTSEGAKSA